MAEPTAIPTAAVMYGRSRRKAVVSTQLPIGRLIRIVPQCGVLADCGVWAEIIRSKENCYEALRATSGF